MSVLCSNCARLHSVLKESPQRDRGADSRGVAAALKTDFLLLLHVYKMGWAGLIPGDIDALLMCDADLEVMDFRGILKSRTVLLFGHEMVLWWHCECQCLSTCALRLPGEQFRVSPADCPKTAARDGGMFQSPNWHWRKPLDPGKGSTR